MQSRAGENIFSEVQCVLRAVSSQEGPAQCKDNLPKSQPTPELPRGSRSSSGFLEAWANEPLWALKVWGQQYLVQFQCDKDTWLLPGKESARVAHDLPLLQHCSALNRLTSRLHGYEVSPLLSESNWVPESHGQGGVTVSMEMLCCGSNMAGTQTHLLPAGAS
jgi:hypothetical protein